NVEKKNHLIALKFPAGRSGTALAVPALRTVRAVLPHTALQSVVASSRLARQGMGCVKGEQPLFGEEHIRPVVMIGERVAVPGSLALLAQQRAQPAPHEAVHDREG